LVLIPICNSLFSQTPDTLWTRIFGGIYSDAGRSLQQTGDGGYIIAGVSDSYSSGGDDVYLIKTDSLGDTIWTKTYGYSWNDEAWSVDQTTDGGYIIGGVTGWFSPTCGDVYLVKIDEHGDTMWTRVYGGNQSDVAREVRQTFDGGYIVIGYTLSFGAGNSDVWMLKTDSLGDTLWTKTYGGALFDYGFSGQQTVDSGYIIAGCYNNENFSADYRKIDFGEVGGDVYLIKTDKYGNMLWSKTFDTGQWEKGYSVKQTTDSGYIVAGYSYLSSFGARIYVIKTDESGDTLWTRKYGTGYNNSGQSIQQTLDGGYIVSGTLDYDFCFMKIDTLGVVRWSIAYGGVPMLDIGYSIIQTSDGGYAAVGETFTPDSGYTSDVWLVRLGPESGIKENDYRHLSCAKIQVYPNPFSGKTYIECKIASSEFEISIHDISGRLIRVFADSDSRQIIWDCRDNYGHGVPEGIYFVVIETPEFTKMKKAILLK
jgi:hypothetical protein